MRWQKWFCASFGKVNQASKYVQFTNIGYPLEFCLKHLSDWTTTMYRLLGSAWIGVIEKVSFLRNATTYVMLSLNMCIAASNFRLPILTFLTSKRKKWNSCQLLLKTRDHTTLITMRRFSSHQNLLNHKHLLVKIQTSHHYPNPNDSPNPNVFCLDFYFFR